MPDNNPVNDQRISLFLRKLWTIVNSPETDNVITWSEVNLLKLKHKLCSVQSKFCVNMLCTYYSTNFPICFICRRVTVL